VLVVCDDGPNDKSEDSAATRLRCGGVQKRSRLSTCSKSIKSSTVGSLAAGKQHHSGKNIVSFIGDYVFTASQNIVAARRTYC